MKWDSTDEVQIKDGKEGTNMGNYLTRYDTSEKRSHSTTIMFFFTFIDLVQLRL